MAKRRVLYGILGLVVACDSPTIPARAIDDVFEFRLTDGTEQRVLRWPNGSRIRVFVQPGPNDQTTELLLAATTHATNAWTDASLFGDYRFLLVGGAEQADVIVSWASATRPVDTSTCVPSGGAAFTTFCLTSEGNRLDPFPLRNSTMASSVRFLVTVRDSEAANPARLRALVTHEFGHVLGIAAHSTSPLDLLYSNPSTVEVPARRDRATLQLLYQTRADITP